jgi:PAS domain S-box-containing protein
MRPEYRISLIYLLVSGAWILFSDTLIAALLPPTAALAVGQVKGQLFVLFTAGLLLMLLRREFNARRASEQALLHSNERFTALFNFAPISLVMCDIQARVLLWNPASERLLGWTEQDVQGKVFDFGTHPDDQALIEDVRRRVQRGEALNDLRLRRMHKQGHPVSLSVYLAPITQHGQVTGYIAAALDLTERERLHEQEAQNQQLQDALRHEQELKQLRDGFLSLLSHDLRLPLAVIQTSAEMLEMYHDRMSGETRHEHYRRIHAKVESLTDMLTDLLAIQRGETVPIQKQPLDLVTLCRTVVEDAQQGSETHTIHFNTDLPGARIVGDERMLRRALANLISNAVKYSPGKSAVEVRLTRLHPHLLTLEVSDQGIGIPQADQERLFGMFQRGSNTGDIPGTGLGLILVKQVIQQHNGGVTLRSTQGVGTTITITLSTS